MKTIPVLDLKNRQVVHAKQGDRAHYLPIHSKLCPVADIFAVLEAFLAVADFDTFYIADLDAITGQGHHDSLIAQVLAAFPEINFWVDKGYQHQQANTLPAYDNYLPVLGSESYGATTLSELAAFDKRFVLSLDYAPSGVALGAAQLFTEVGYWPQNIIIMALAQVGSGLGPDWARLKTYCAAYPDYNFIAAGGVRHLGDLRALSDMGVRCALVASALHSGAIGRGELLNLRQKNTPAN